MKAERIKYVLVYEQALKTKELHRRLKGVYNRVIFNNLPASEAVSECVTLLANQTGKAEIVEIMQELLIMAADERMDAQEMAAENA